MKFIFTFTIALFACLSLSGQEKIVVAGSGNLNIAIVDKNTGHVEWTHSIEKGEECNSVNVNKKGEILYSYKKGARLITLEKETVWDFKAPENSELQSATILKNGNYLLGICGNPARLVEVDKKGITVHEILIDLNIDNPHSQFRQITELKNGNFLIPVLRNQEVLEINRKGDIIRRIPSKPGPFAVLEQKDGTLLFSRGDAHHFALIDRESGNEIGQVTSECIQGANLLFVAQIIQLPTDNLLICNWHGHTKDPNADEPQLLEIDKDKNVVWSLNDKESVGKVSAACFVSNPKIFKGKLK